MWMLITFSSSISIIFSQALTLYAFIKVYIYFHRVGLCFTHHSNPEIP